MTRPASCPPMDAGSVPDLCSLGQCHMDHGGCPGDRAPLLVLCKMSVLKQSSWLLFSPLLLGTNINSILE